MLRNAGLAQVVIVKMGNILKRMNRRGALGARAILTTVIVAVLAAYALAATLPDIFDIFGCTTTWTSAPTWFATLALLLVGFGAIMLIYRIFMGGKN